MWLCFYRMSCFADVVHIRFGISIVSNLEILIFMISAKSEHLFHISTALIVMKTTSIFINSTLCTVCLSCLEFCGHPSIMQTEECLCMVS